MDGRDTSGRFAKGHTGGPGRPPKHRELEYYRITLNNVPPSGWAKVVQKALSQAQEGDHQARKWLGDYLLGKDAVQVLELVEQLRLELEELRAGAAHAA